MWFMNKILKISGFTTFQLSVVDSCVTIMVSIWQYQYAAYSCFSESIYFLLANLFGVGSQMKENEGEKERERDKERQRTWFESFCPWTQSKTVETSLPELLAQEQFLPAMFGTLWTHLGYHNSTVGVHSGEECICIWWVQTRILLNLPPYTGQPSATRILQHKMLSRPR